MKSVISMNRSSGFTLIELMITIAVLAILVAIAAPSIRKIIKDNEVSSETNELISLINLARSQSIRRNGPVTIQIAPVADGAGWSGLVRIEDCDGPDCPTAEDCPPNSNFIRCANNRGVTVNGDNSMTFNNRGHLDSWTDVKICLKHSDCQGNRQHKKIAILRTGQLSKNELACDDDCL